MTKIHVLFAALAVGVAGCSSGSTAAFGQGSSATSSTAGHVSPGPSAAASASQAGPATPPPKAGVLRVSDLLSSPDAWLGRDVEVDVLEDIVGPATPEALATVQYGAPQVRTPGFADVSLVPEPFVMSNPRRYLTKFDHVVTGPVRVHGKFERDDDPELHEPYVLVVHSMEPIDLGKPVPAPPISEILAHRADWDGRYVVYEGEFRSGFELATIDGKMWLGGTGTTEHVGEPNPPVNGISTTRVRVTGIVYAREGHRYGHMGMGDAEIAAYKVEYLR